MRHTLTNVNRSAKTAVCGVCGPTNIQVRGAGVRCGGKRRADKVAAQIRSYGITVEGWHAMLIAQSGRCAICSDPMLSPHIDHCHVTGAVRGLLCSECNHGLGKFKDSQERLLAAVDYLEKQNGPRGPGAILLRGRVVAHGDVVRA